MHKQEVDESRHAFVRRTKMKQLEPLVEFDMGREENFEFETLVLERNNTEADLLIKKGYKIRKHIWNGLMAS